MDYSIKIYGFPSYLEALKSQVRNVKHTLTSEVECDNKYAVYSWVTVKL